MSKNEVIYKIKAVILILMIVSCNTIQTNTAISKILTFRKKVDKDKKSSKSLDKFNNHESTKISLSKKFSNKVETKKRLKTKFFFLVLGIIVLASVLIKTASVIIDHGFLYPAQKEIFRNLSEEQKNRYKLRAESCSMSKITSFQNRSMLFAYKLRFTPFKYGTFKLGDNCECKLRENNLLDITNECNKRCNFINEMRNSINISIKQNEYMANKYDQTVDIRCGWKPTDDDEKSNDLYSKYETLVENQTDLWTDISSTVNIVTNAATSFLGVDEFKKNFNNPKENGIAIDFTAKMESSIRESTNLIIYLKETKASEIFSKGAIETISTIVGWINTILTYINTAGSFWPDTKYVKVSNLIQLIINIISNITNFVKNEIKSAYDVLNEIGNFAENLRDIGSTIFDFFELNKANAVFIASMDLIISALRLAKSIVGLVDVKKDETEVENIKIKTKEEGKAKTKLMCQDERMSMKTAIKTQNNIKMLEHLDYEVDFDKHLDLKKDLIDLCYSNVNLCVNFAKARSKNFKDFISSESKDDDNYNHILNYGPISDIIVSYDDGYDSDFERLGLKKYNLSGTSKYWNKNIYICRACNTQVITSICLIEKEKAFMENSKCRNNKTSDSIQRVIHLSYNYSLIIDIIDIAKGSKDDITYVQSFDLKLETINEGPSFKLTSVLNNSHYLSYSNGRYSLKETESFSRYESAIDKLNKSNSNQNSTNELENIINDFCIDNCTKDINSQIIVNKNNKCLNFYKRHKHHYMFLEVSKYNRSEEIDELKKEYNDLCVKCPDLNYPKKNCATFYDQLNYAGNSWSYCDNTQTLLSDAKNFKSVKVDDRYFIKAYSEKYFNNPIISLQGNIPDLHKYQDKILSFKLCLRLDIGCTDGLPLPGCATFYEHVSFEGRSLNICKDTEELDKNWSNKFSSVRIDSKSQLIIYKEKQYKGKKVKIDKDISNLKNINGDIDFNDMIQSVKICLKSDENCNTYIRKNKLG